MNQNQDLGKFVLRVALGLMILLHGIGRLARSFDPIAPHFTDRYRVIAMDLRGHGDSGQRQRAHQDL